MPIPSTMPTSGPFHVSDKDRGVTFSKSVDKYGTMTHDTSEKRTHKLSARLLNDPSSIARMQKLLLLLRHASKCSNRNDGRKQSDDSDDAEGAGKTPEICPIYIHCNPMKKLWKHISQCRHKASNGADRSCPFPNCNIIRYALWHYKNCVDGQACQVCGPVKMMMAKEAEAMACAKMEAQKRALVDEEKEEGPTKRQRVETNQQKPAGNVTGSENTVLFLNDDTKGICLRLLQNMLNHEYGWVFSSPVDPVLLNIPDYFDVIKHPMDLGTIEKRLKSGFYKDLQGFREDVMLIFDNATSYNMEGTEVHDMAVKLKNNFLADYDEIGKLTPMFH